MAKKNKGIIFDESDDYFEEVSERFRNNMTAFEHAQWNQPFQVLVDSGISLPPPIELAESDLHTKLWEIINALSLVGVYLEHTDHLSDRELYALLWKDLLREEVVFQSSAMNLACFIDLIGSGSEEDNAIYLKYYADDDDRKLWIEEFPDAIIPARESLPMNRDRRLPKPNTEEKFEVH